MRTVRLFLVSLFFILASHQVAVAKSWIVERVAGAAWVKGGTGEPRPLKPGMWVEDGEVVGTAKNGRVMLVQGKNRMSLSPNTIVSVEPSWFFSRKIKVLQQVGTVEIEVEKRRAPYFTVKTPYMAAVVKGTRFGVTVSGKGTSVAVDSGLVNVACHKTGQTAELGAGQRAQTNGMRGLAVDGATRPEVVPGQPFASDLAPPATTVVDMASVGLAAAGKSSAKGSGNAANMSGKAQGASASANAGGKGNSGNAGGNGNSGNAGGNGNSGNAGGNGNGNGGGRG